MAKKTLHEFVREMEVVEFPELSENEHHILRIVDNAVCAYHTPSHHFRKGLVDEEIIRDLKEKGKSVLTLGCGHAYLERLLVQRFGVSPAQIELVDQHAQEIPAGFRAYSFDVTQEWPCLDRTYDYVFIPESFTCLIPFQRDGFRGDSEMIDACYDLFVRALHVLPMGGQVRGDGHCLTPEELRALEYKMQNCHVANSIKYDQSLLVVEKVPTSSQR